MICLAAQSGQLHATCALVLLMVNIANRVTWCCSTGYLRIGSRYRVQGQPGAHCDLKEQSAFDLTGTHNITSDAAQLYKRNALYVSILSSVCLSFGDSYLGTDLGTREAVSKPYFIIREEEDVTWNAARPHNSDFELFIMVVALL